jgi:enoyl-CoA hydratase/carnithine racemase
MSSAYRFLKIERHQAVVTVLLDKPPMNILDEDLYQEFERLADEIDSDPESRAVVFGSCHPKVFIAGADIKEMRNYRFERDFVAGKIARVHAVFNRLEDITRPTLAAITGHALGGGCEFALAMDFRFMAQGPVRIGLPEINIGIIPGGGGTQRLPRVVGYPKATELMMTGARLDAEQAQSVGLVHRACPPESTLTAAQEFAGILAAQAPVAIRLLKQCLRESFGLSREPGMAVEREKCLQAVLSADAREGFAAFLEKRRPRWSGK